MTKLSVNFNHALFIHLSTHDDLTVLVFVWLCIVWLRVIGFGAVWSGAFTQISDDLSYLSTKFKDIPYIAFR